MGYGPLPDNFLS